MALRISNLTISLAGGSWRVKGQLTGDGNYPTGGYPLTSRLVGLATIDSVTVLEGKGAATGVAATGFIPEYDEANQKLKLMRVDAFANITEVAAATDVSNFASVTFIATGT